MWQQVRVAVTTCSSSRRRKLAAALLPVVRWSVMRQQVRLAVI